MKFRNRKQIMILIFLIIIFTSYIAFIGSRFQYKLFLMIIVIGSLTFYVFAIFEYFEVDNYKISYISSLTALRKEVEWNEIKEIYVYRQGIFKVIRIRYGSLEKKEIVINSGIKDYKKLIKLVLKKVHDNRDISIYRMVYKIIE